MATESMTVHEVERLIEAGVSASALGPLIDCLAIEPEERAALWLRAWCEERRRADADAVPGRRLG